jgi:hypothetical protein
MLNKLTLNQPRCEAITLELRFTLPNWRDGNFNGARPELLLEAPDLHLPGDAIN